jgi:deoxyribonuclease-4
MRVRFGPAGIPLGFRGGTAAGIGYTADLGLTAFECEFVRGVNLSMQAAAEAGEIAGKNNILLSCHCPYWINCSPRVESKVKIALQGILQSARAAHAMGARIIVLHPGYYMGRKPEDAEKKALNTLEKALDMMSSEGLEDVTLGLETTGKRSQLGTLEEVIEMSELLDSTLPVVDFAHIHARTNGSLAAKEDYGRIFNQVEDELGPDVAKNLHCHFSEIEYTDKGERRHLKLGETNSPPYQPLAEEIAQRRWEPTIISESPLLDQDALKMKEILEELMRP